jgi:hypothetical protein
VAPPVGADRQDIDPSDMTHIANCLGLIRRAVLVVGLVGSSSVHFRAQAGPRTVCFPPNWAGIVAGITEDRDLVTLHGRGLFSAELGHGGGRYYSDAQHRMTMVVELGVDQIIESISLELGQHGPSKARASLPISRRIDIGEGFGVFHKLRLGSTEAEVRGNLGEPTETRAESETVKTLVYQTDYTNTDCYADAGISIVLTDGRVTRIVFYNGD